MSTQTAKEFTIFLEVKTTVEVKITAVSLRDAAEEAYSIGADRIFAPDVEVIDGDWFPTGAHRTTEA